MALDTQDRDELLARLSNLRNDVNALLDEVAKEIIGQEAVLRLMLAASFARGHCLLVGVPGLAKTSMVKALARALDLPFKRIQFTPDLMPSDITGTEVLFEEQGARGFRFVQGPLFASVILADEINRTPPKTQAALLEAMQERQVTVANRTHELPNPFLVIATQNPIEQEGTYELPEAQLDRFMFQVEVNYPSLQEEESILMRASEGLMRAAGVLDGDRVREIQALIQGVHCTNYMVSYVARLIRATRPGDDFSPAFVNELVEWGAGPRAGQFLIQGGKALAAMDGRPTVSPADIQALAVPVLRHRVAPNFQAQADGVTSVDLIRRVLEATPIPKG
ncbi:MAG: MoxR family ATPase [Planctomycetota bacterium]|nr:MoxR family ATPase [Planctomycetota bacterium]